MNDAPRTVASYPLWSFGINPTDGRYGIMKPLLLAEEPPDRLNLNHLSLPLGHV
ncbi:MAG: hypothetical protein PWP44_1504 [Thermacetogenium sp.]|jgi:hypothetical protein|nr:hypothetical protein [Thermacetogenium sp.]